MSARLHPARLAPRKPHIERLGGRVIVAAVARGPLITLDEAKQALHWRGKTVDTSNWTSPASRKRENVDESPLSLQQQI